MSLSKDSFDKAKRRAHERLTGWITDIQHENEIGIERLHRQFKNTFKKIEYIPKDILKIENGKERIIQRRRTNEEKKDTDVKEDSDKARVSTAPNDEIQDSNSSNLSSRLENIRDEVRITESRTPYNKTPLLIPDTDSKDSDISKEADKQSVLNAVLRLGQERRRSSLFPEVLPGIMPFQKKWRSNRFKKAAAAIMQKSDVPNIEVVTEANEDADEDEVLNDQPENEQSTITKKSSSVLSSAGPTPRQNVKSYKLSKGPIDLLLRRATRQYRKNLPSKHELPTVKVEQTSEEKRKELLTKFRRCIRLLIHVRVLLNVSRIRVQEEEKSKSFKRYDGGLELSFDATMFKCAVSYSGLTSRAKQALKKNPKDRTKDDAKILMEVLIRLPMFMKYPKAVKEALAHMIWYDTFQDGRVIVKQGDPGTRMYFVISGEVDLKRTDELDTGEQICYHLRTVREGATFGELALIRNMRREFTAICRGTSEFLSLSKDEFNQALRSRWEKDCNKRFNFLRTCEHFTAWTDKQLQMCADSSELKEYGNNSVILGDMDGETENVYFIRRGKCEIVRRILVVRHQSPYQRPNILLPKMAKRRSEFLNKPYCRDRRIDREEIRFLTVTSLLPGNYFGVGENLRDTFILSRGKTELLIINSAQFSIQGKSEQLRRLKRERDTSIPSNKALYKKFQENRKWFEYRNQLLKDILLRKKAPCSTSILDVPRSILTEPTIPKDIVFYNKKY